MKRSLTLASLLAAGLGMTAFAQTAAPAAPDAPAGPAKIAVIAFQGAVAQTNEGQRNFTQLRQKFEPKQTQLKNLSDEIDSLKKQLQAGGDKLSDQERATRTRTIDEKEKSLQRSAEDAQNDFQSEMGEMYQALAQKVYEVMQNYVQQQGYTLVVDVSGQQSPVLWAAQSSDITQAVVQAYNAKSGVAAPANAAPAAPRPATNRPPAAARPAATPKN